MLTYAGKMDVVAYGHRLNLTGLWTRQDLPLSNPTFLEVTKDLVNRVMERPDTENFLHPVRPIEDGCAGIAFRSHTHTHTLTHTHTHTHTQNGIASRLQTHKCTNTHSHISHTDVHTHTH
jgi:hypothetical protein